MPDPWKQELEAIPVISRHAARAEQLAEVGATKNHKWPSHRATQMKAWKSKHWPQQRQMGDLACQGAFGRFLEKSVGERSPAWSYCYSSLMGSTQLTLRELPFPQQTVAIDHAVQRGDIASLIATLAAFRDHQPLAYALAALGKGGQLGELRDSDAACFVALPDTSLRRVLAALSESVVPGRVLRAIAAAAMTLPIERVAAAALVDRWLKNNAKELRQSHVTLALEAVRAKIEGDRIVEIDDAKLFRVPGADFAALSALARKHGNHEALRDRIDRFATSVLDALERQPKSLSQANAEELLANQVYTEPEHFLFELLQNADDAGATRWRVRIEPDRVEIEHNGVPFDARDVVGILSIGQSTKSKEQIGFFGVGFKSVYAVCERPQIYSGPFAFEIANVSVPRRLAPRQRTDARTNADAQSTLLVLPLRASTPTDVLFDRLASLPGEVLLTLNALREIDVTAGDRHHRVNVALHGTGRVELKEVQRSRFFLLEKSEAHYPAERAANRATTTPLLIALPLDEDGVPISIGRRPTVYSYLPTKERSGLHFLIHAHFDVPVDRERLDLSSSWNQWAISSMGPLLSAAIGRLVAEWESERTTAAADRLDGALAVVPLPAELGAEEFATLASALSDVVFLPGADGDRIAGSSALWSSEDALLEPLAGVVIGGRRLLRRLSGRNHEVAKSLGATTLLPSAIVNLLAEDGRSRMAGARFDPPWASGLTAIAAALVRANVDLASLRDLPCLPDEAGLARRPAEVLRADAELRALLAPVSTLLDARLEARDCEAFLVRLGVAKASDRDLVTALMDSVRAAAIAAAVGIDRVLQRLANVDSRELGDVLLAFVSPNTEGTLSAIGDAFVTGNSQLASLVRAATVRPSLVARSVEERHGELLAKLGAPRLSLSSSLELIANGSLAFEPSQIGALHAAINETRDSISPALARRLAAAPIFAAEDGSTNPLVGPERTAIPADDDIRELWPGHRWLTNSIASQPYVRHLGIEAVGAKAVAEHLLAEPTSAEQRRRFFRYLAEHSDDVRADKVAALANARLWPDSSGELRRLDELRQPSPNPVVARLYEIWPRAKTIERDIEPGDALHLAAALGLAHHVAPPSLLSAIEEITVFGHEPAFETTELAAAVADVLNAAAMELPRSAVERARAAPIFRCVDGQRRRLATWAQPKPDRAHRVSKPLLAAFSRTRLPVLAADEERRLRPFLDALGVAVAGAVDLIHAIDPSSASIDDEGATEIRAALVASRVEMISPSSELADALGALAIWPTNQGLLPAIQVMPEHAFKKVVGAAVGEWAAELEARGVDVLSAHAEPAARALAEIVAFADARHHVAKAIPEIARANRVLSEQPALLGSRERVAALAVALANQNRNWELPLSINSRGELRAGALRFATPDEIEFLGALDVAATLADPVWAARVLAADSTALATVTVRQILVAVTEASAEPRDATSSTAAHPFLSTERGRTLFYQWLLTHREEIHSDSQSLGALGRSCVVLSSQGVLRDPRAFLYDSALPDLGIDWNPATSVPAPLVAFLRSAFQPATKQLRALVDHLVSAHDRAVANKDGDQLHELLGHLARVLGGDDDETLTARVRQFQLRKRLRVETGSATFERVRTLLAPDAVDTDLIARFAIAEPAKVATRYRTGDVLRLFRASGANRQLTVPVLRGFIAGTNRKSGPDSAVALACYLGHAAEQESSLRQELDLRNSAWLADQTGAARVPSELYWASDEIVALVGNRPEHLVHDEVVRRVGDVLGWSGVRKRDAVELADVGADLGEREQQGRAIDEASLSWLDDGLGDGALENTAVREVFADRRVLVDDRGRLRRPSELVVQGAEQFFGQHRGDYSPGARLPRLMSALRIAARPGKREVLGFLARLVATLEFDDGVCECDRDLAVWLRESLALLIASRGRGPTSLPVVCLGADQYLVAHLPRAADRVGFRGDDDEKDDDEREFIVLPSDQADIGQWRRYLVKYGVGKPETPQEAPRSANKQAEAPLSAESRKPPRPRPKPPEETEETEETRGVLSRVRRWLRGDESDDEHDERDEKDQRPQPSSPPPSTPPPQPRGGSTHRPSEGGSRRQDSQDSQDSQEDDDEPFRPVNERAWFDAQESLSSQLRANPQWLAGRMQVPEFGFAHTPRSLPLPYLYAPNSIFGTFDRRRQQWRQLECQALWFQGGARVGTVQLRGRLPAGSSVVPLPLYGRLESHDQSDALRVAETQGATFAISRHDLEASIEVALARAPDFSNAGAFLEAPAALRGFTVSDQELPAEVHDLIASLVASRNTLAIANTVRSFVRERYVYDATYLENADVARWLRQRTNKRSNVHVAALHAGRDTDHLGRGVCYELNALVCEIMRRCGVACAVATGWTFDDGTIAEPDHLWAMALVAAADGPRWLPIDAASTTTGRPVRIARRPPGPWRASATKTETPPQPEWARRERKRSRAPSIPLADFLRVARFVERSTNRHLGNRDELLAACRALLANPAALGQLLVPDEEE